MLSKTATMVFLAWLAVAMAASGTEALVEARGLWAIDGDTIMVEFEGGREEVRYASVNAPRSDDPCLGEEAKLANDQLIRGEALWLELDLNNGEYRRVRNRLLAHVFLEPVRTPSTSVSVLLVAQGLARLDVIDPTDREILAGKDFNVRYTDWIIEAQIKAAKDRVGWWGECDPYRDSELVIAAIKQWTDETVYIVNRGAKPVNLAGWSLRDRANNELIFSERLIGACLLPPGGVLRVHSGPVATGRGGTHTPCGEAEIDWYWTGRRIWGQGGDEAWLDWNNQPRYHYVYPPKEWD